MIKAIMFGAGESGRKLLPDVAKKFEIIAFTDNDERKWENRFENIPIYSPEECLTRLDFQYVIISSTFGLDSIKKQCMDKGITEDRLITSYIEAPVESRRIFLHNFAMCCADIDKDAQCAEAGVFTGDFAKYINQYFPDRKLHLFDTFEGFDQRDIDKEKNYHYSLSQAGEYCNPSIEVVMNKMIKPNNCIIHKGYFPQTADGITSKFLFVNLDMDLYEPTYAGLHFFGDKIVQRGGILIHDYFADEFKGPKKAVDEYVAEKKNIFKVPIGDSSSIFLVGF